MLDAHIFKSNQFRNKLIFCIYSRYYNPLYIRITYKFSTYSDNFLRIEA